MPKKILESQKKEIIDNFIKGLSIEELSEKFKFAKTTITRHLKRGVNEENFKSLLEKNKKNKLKPNLKNIKKEDSKTQRSEEEVTLESIEAASFIEIAPLNFEIDSEPQKDLSSISINEIDLPKIVYMIINNKIELETKLLGDYSDWQFLSKNELNRSTIEIFFDIKIAKRFCSKEQKVIKVPNTDIFKIVAPILVSRGISRIISSDKLIAL